MIESLIDKYKDMLVGIKNRRKEEVYSFNVGMEMAVNYFLSDLVQLREIDYRLEELNKLFVSGNDVDVDEYIRVGRDEWRSFYNSIKGDQK